MPIIKRNMSTGILLLIVALSAVRGDVTESTDNRKLHSCREKLLELEDEHEDLLKRFNVLSEEYKDVKKELRATIACETTLDETTRLLDEVREDVEQRKEQLKNMDVLLVQCERKRDNCLVDLHVSETSLEESLARERQLERQLNKEDCVAVKRDAVSYRDQAEQCLIDLDALKKREEELVKRAGDLEEVEKELETTKGLLEAASSDRESLNGRVDALEKKTVVLEEVERELETTKVSLQRAESSLESRSNELNATKTALNSLLESLDSHLQYEALKDAHEKEILPYWLERLVKKGVHVCDEAYHKYVQPLHESFGEAVRMRKKHVAGRVKSIHGTVKYHASRVVSVYVVPMMSKTNFMLRAQFPGGWRACVDTTRSVAELSRNVVNTYLNTCREFGMHIKHRGMEAIEHQIVKVSFLQQLDSRIVASSAFWTLVGLITLPLGIFIFIMVSKVVVYYCRSGTASVSIVNISDAIGLIEEDIGYTFSLKDNLIQALEGSPHLYQVGMAVVNLLLAKQQNNARATLAEVEARSLCSASLGRIVQRGPGRKSLQAARQQKNVLYIAILAAVFRDSRESVQTVLNVWNGRGSPAAVPPVREEEIEEEIKKEEDEEIEEEMSEKDESEDVELEDDASEDDESDTSS